LDPFTHALFGYVFIFWAGKIRPIPKKYQFAIIMGSVLPDLDVFLNWVSYLAPKFYWLEHRAMSHSLLGVIPYILIVAGFLSIPRIKDKLFTNWLKEKPNFFSLNSLLAFYIGALIHFLADFFVPTGMMLFFPISFNWYSVKILSSNNIHTIAAIMFATTIWPMKWDYKRRNKALAFFILTFTCFSAVRISVNIRANQLFQQKYGASQFSSSEYIFSYNVNYQIYDASNPDNRTFLVAIIDGLKMEFVSEEFIPEIRIRTNNATLQSIGNNLVNVTRSNPHYYRFWQKNNILCAEAKQLTNDDWLIRWFAPIRQAEKRTQLLFLNIERPLEVVFHINASGIITHIDRPLSV